MKVFATTAIEDSMPDVATYVPLFTRLAEQDRFCTHKLVNDPDSADIILFMDGHQHYLDMKLRAIRNHPLVRKHREKAFVYNEQDQPWCAMPGLYVGMPKKSFNPQRQRACAYLNSPNPYVVAGQGSKGSPDLLFSFMGRGGNQTRQRILRQSHPRACIADTSTVDFFASPHEDIERQKKHYADVMGRSKFVLCPLGAGPASFRIFETMAAGRVPVILSDSWMPPHGPDWKNCALFIREQQVDELAGILQKHEEHFHEMALAARREWEQWFAPDVLFHRMTEGIGDILKTRRVPESVLSRKFDTRYLRLRARSAKGIFKKPFDDLQYDSNKDSTQTGNPIPLSAMNTPPKDTMHKELTGQRYVLVDALRGIAALSVLCHHLLHNSQLQAALWTILPAWFAAFCHYGAFGVQIFFVLSGFVIAHSLRNVQLSPGALGNFLLRRQLRLDPPYWTVLLITLATLAVETHFPWIKPKSMPGFTDVLTQMFYLQDITRLPDSVHILGVAWTLCLEVQFYLVFILLLIAGKYLSNSRVKAADISLLLVVILGIVSIALPKMVLEAWFIQYWYYFAAGVVCYWSVRDRRYRFTFIGFLVLILIGVTTKEPLRLLTGGATALLLFTAGSMGGLTRWLNIPVLQYLGRISYSLYLIHLCVATYVLRFGYRITGESPAGALLWFVLAGALSILAGHLLYVTVERRSMQFASRFKPAQTAKDNNPKASNDIILSHCTPVVAKRFQDA